MTLSTSNGVMRVNRLSQRGLRCRFGLNGSRQHGVSLIGLVLLVVVVGFVFVVGLRVVPTFVEYRAISSAVKKAHDSAHSVVEIQKQFDRSAAIDDITVMDGKDLDIVKDNDDYVITFAYAKKIPLFGPVSLVIDYAGGSKSL